VPPQEAMVPLEVGQQARPARGEACELLAPVLVARAHEERVEPALRVVIARRLRRPEAAAHRDRPLGVGLVLLERVVHHRLPHVLAVAPVHAEVPRVLVRDGARPAQAAAALVPAAAAGVARAVHPHGAARGGRLRIPSKLARERRGGRRARAELPQQARPARAAPVVAVVVAALAHEDGDALVPHEAEHPRHKPRVVCVAVRRPAQQPPVLRAAVCARSLLDADRVRDQPVAVGLPVSRRRLLDDAVEQAAVRKVRRVFVEVERAAQLARQAHGRRQQLVAVRAVRVWDIWAGAVGHPGRAILRARAGEQ
jgi:hypothetical protein